MGRGPVPGSQQHGAVPRWGLDWDVPQSAAAPTVEQKEVEEKLVGFFPHLLPADFCAQFRLSTILGTFPSQTTQVSSWVVSGR